MDTDCDVSSPEQSGVCRQAKRSPMEGVRDQATDWIQGELTLRGNGNVLFTREKLRLFDGSVADRLLVLCVLGECFNVSAGEQFYGADQHYGCFAGNDGSRAYVTGEFTPEGCHDDVSDFSGEQMIGVEHWLDFYKKHAEYTRVGLLVGPYFADSGSETSLRVAVLQRAAQQRKDEVSMKTLPGCNSVFEAATEHQPARDEVWCSSDSGGINRHWIGLPRIEQGQQGRANRCVCVPEDRLLDEGLSVYPNCPPEANRCSILR